MTKRIEAIDTCRGIMLLFMMVTHLYLFPFVSISYLLRYTYGFLGFFTDPEGFFFLSGLVSGMVYGKYYLQGRAQEGDIRIYKRAGQIYFWQMALFAAFSLAVACSPSYIANWLRLHDIVPGWGEGGIHFCLEHPWQALALGAFFLHLPPFLDILPMFVLFLACAPFVLRQLQKGRLASILILSLALWLIAQTTTPRILESLLRVYSHSFRLGWFDFCGWQILFVAGLTFGFFHMQGRLRAPPRWVTLLSLTTAAAFFFLKHFGPDLTPHANLYTLGPLRVLSFGSVALCIWSFHRFFTWPFFSLIGRNALPVFVYHVAAAFFLVYYLEEISALSFPPKIALLALCTMSIWVPALFNERHVFRMPSQLKR